MKLWAGAESQPAGRLHPLLGPLSSLGDHRSGSISQLCCAACVCLTSFLSLLERRQEQLVPADSVLIICKHTEMQGADFALLTWREMMSHGGVLMVHRLGLGDLEEALKPIWHLWFCMGEHKQAKQGWAYVTVWFVRDASARINVQTRPYAKVNNTDFI